MKISIVVATHNRCHTLARTLPTLVDQDFPAGQREVIVVDDGSTDATADYLRTFRSPCQFAVLRQPNQGPAAARNAGIFAARGELVLLLDDDMLCGRTLVSGHVAAHQETQPIVAFGPITLAPESRDSVALSWLKSGGDRNTAGSNQSPSSKYQAWATNCSVPRAVLLAQGGYDERFVTHEDAELAIRLWEAGVGFRFDPALAISELYDKLPRRLLKTDARRLGRNEALLCRKHPGYRPHSRQADLQKAALGPLFIWLACRLPVSPEPALGPLQFLAERLRPARRADALAMLLFKCRMAIEQLRGTLEESGSWQAFHDRFGIKLRVLRYSNMSLGFSARDRKSGVSPGRFERHLVWLSRRGYSPIGSSQWRAWIDQGCDLPSKPILLTFDNAYAWLEDALPILRRNGFGAVVFADSSGGAQGVADTDLMTAVQMRRWASAGIEFAVCGPTHLSRLGAAQMRQELIRREGNLETVLGSRVKLFVYPGGLYNDALRKCAEGLFELAFTHEPGVNALHTDLLRIHTTPTAPETGLSSFASRVMLGQSPMEMLRPGRNRAESVAVGQGRIVSPPDELTKAAPR